METPLFDICHQELKKEMFIIKGIDRLAEIGGEEYLSFCEDHLNKLYLYHEQDPEKLKKACKSFALLTFDVLKMYGKYQKSGQFSPYVSEQHAQAVYENQELMEGQYLSGLFLSYIFWPNHYHLIRFYLHDFFPLIESARSFLDLGTGPGINTVYARSVYPELKMTGIDISPFAIEMTRKMHDRNDPAHEPEKLVLHQNDVIEWLQKPAEPFDAVVMAGLLEHLDEPELLFKRLRGVLHPGARVFLTTATHSAFYDHSTVFESVDEIEALFKNSGWKILNTRTVPTYGTEPDTQSDVVNYFAIVEME